MNGFEQNPYAASKVVATDTRYSSGVARRVSLRALQSLFLAFLFCLSFLFLGDSVQNGITDAWDYTIWFVTEYPILTATIVLWNWILRVIFLPRPQLRTVWLPLFAGVASFLTYNSVHSRVGAIRQMIIPQSWGSEIWELLLEGIEPSFVGILVEGVGHGILLILKRNTS